MRQRNKYSLLLLTALLAACSSPIGRVTVTYDTSFRLIFVGNMFRHEGAVPEGYLDYSHYFGGSIARFSLNATCSLLFTEKRNGAELIHEFTGIYTATRAYNGGRFSIVFDEGDSLDLIWAPNWHDPNSTPYEAYLTKSFYIEELGGETEVVFTYACNYLSEM